MHCLIGYGSMTFDFAKGGARRHGILISKCCPSGIYKLRILLYEIRLQMTHAVVASVSTYVETIINVSLIPLNTLAIRVEEAYIIFS